MPPRLPTRSPYLMAAACTLLLATAAHAGTVTDGQWTPSGCGAAPQAPQLDLSNADRYNRGVEAVNTYRQAIRPYLDCVVKEANGDIQVIGQSATAAQQAAKVANEKIQADVKTAQEKFK
ncbi:MAG: hypothetical protein EOP40_04550 [Rubrivivax sp.]|nr:MAG: hypothetical protein EOP40_04550 [Rubrivivax sp.]